MKYILAHRFTFSVLALYLETLSNLRFFFFRSFGVVVGQSFEGGKALQVIEFIIFFYSDYAV